MTNQPSQPSSKPFKPGDVLQHEGETAGSLSILLKGKVSIHVSLPTERATPAGAVPGKDSSFRLFDLEGNIFLGACALVTDGIYNFTCRASGEGILCSYPVESPSRLFGLARAQKDYSTFIIQSLGVLLEKARDAFSTIDEHSSRLRVMTDNLALFFWILKENHRFELKPVTPLFQRAFERLGQMRKSGFQPPFRFDPSFIEASPAAPGNHDPGVSRPEQADPEDGDRIEVPDPVAYAIRLNKIPQETRKLFFSSDIQVAARHIRDASDSLNSLLSDCRKRFSEVEGLLRELCAESGDSLFSAFLGSSREMASAGQDPKASIEALDYLIARIRETVELIKSRFDHHSPIDLEYIGHEREQLAALLTGSSDGAGAGGESSSFIARMNALPDELRDSASRLLAYSGLDKEFSDSFMSHLNAFRNLKDRFSQTPEAKGTRAEMLGPFRRLFEAVLRRALAEGDQSRLVTMFLRYGFVDEWLLDPEQTLSIFRFAGQGNFTPVPAKASEVASVSPPAVVVFTLREWLQRIFTRQVEPSRNEFDTDYSDVFTELKKQRKVTDHDKPAFDANVDAKLSFELDTQLGTCQKAVFGRPSNFFPMLHQAMITTPLEKAAVSLDRVREALERIQTVDYSAFWREVRFIDPRKVIEKERIMKCVMPDIVVLPTYGSRGIMWQEIGGRDRSLPGRFFLPAFTDENLETLLIRLVGRYRWELTITLMGVAANDPTQPSLTSEYGSYIQLYKKNPNLSDSEKENTRQLVEQSKGVLRDVFTAHYEIWIRNESQGNLRLDKEARGILSRYCPFAKPIREKLANHPAHADLLRLFQGSQSKEARGLEGRYAKFRAAAKGYLPPDLEENLRFFRDL